MPHFLPSPFTAIYAPLQGLYASLTSSSVLGNVLRSLLSEALHNTVRRELVRHYGPAFNAAWTARRTDVERYSSFISHSLSTILNGSQRRRRRDADAEEDEDEDSAQQRTQAPPRTASAADLKRLLDDVDVAQYPPKLILVSVQSSMALSSDGMHLPT